MKRFGHYAIKMLRFTSWPLLVVVLCYVTSGFVMSGQYGFGGLMDPKIALIIHRTMRVPLIVLLLLHALCATYLAMRRKRWIRW